MDFSKNLRDELEYQGIQVKELSEKTGISVHTLDKYRPGSKVIPNIENAKKIADALHVSLDYLITGADYKPESRNPKIQEATKNMRTLTDSQLEALLIIIKSMK